MDATESTPNEGDGPDGSDKPPHASTLKQTSPSKPHLALSDKFRLNGTRQKRSASQSKPPTSPVLTTPNRGLPSHPPGHVPLPPPESYSYQKAPGHTRKDLEKLHTSADPHQKHTSSSTTDSMTPSMTDSPSPSESGSWSLPSTQPPSRTPSRPPSFSAGKSGGKVDPPRPSPRPKSASKKDNTRPPSPTPSPAAPPAPRSRAPSVNSDGGQKFTLKDLLGTPKLVRRASMRSNGSSKKSDSDRGPRSTAGDSTASLLKKYGVCEKVAIGKGATSVVRLAHKWDRSEEKLYAVKVRPISSHPLSYSSSLILSLTGVPKEAQKRDREGIRQEAHRRVLYLIHPSSH